MAVVAVVLFHADVPWMRGGFLGVDVFFVLSGFLVTGMLLREVQRTGHIAVGTFYRNRGLRLLPPLAAVMATVIVAARWWVPDAARHLRGDILAASLFYSNWWYLTRGESYFESSGRPPLLRHLWSLSVEEQFYLAMPVVTLLLVRRYGSASLGRLHIMLAGVTTATMAGLSILWQVPESNDGTALYYGTHTHTMGMFVGGALATRWGWWNDDKRPAWRSARVVTGVGVLSLATLLACFVVVPEDSPVLYRGGFLGLALVTGAVLVSVVDMKTGCGRWLGWAPLRWCGTRSYGIYLWHYPVFSLTRPELDLPFGGWRALLFRVAVVALVTEASYRLLELPLLRLRRCETPLSLRRLVKHAVLGHRYSTLRAAAAMALVVMVLIAVATPPEANEVAPPDVRRVLSEGVESPLANDVPPPARQLPHAAADRALDVPRPTTRASSDEVTAIGDSVLLATAQAVRGAIDGAVVDAEVGRQPAQVVRLVEARSISGQLAPVVLVQLGANGYVTETQLRRIVDAAGTRRVIVVNTRVPRAWMQPNNDRIKRVAGEYPNVVVVDWASISSGHPEYLVSDGVHPTAAGQRALVAEILRTGLAQGRAVAKTRADRAAVHSRQADTILSAGLRRGEMPRVSGSGEFRCLVQAEADPGASAVGSASLTCDQFRNPVALDTYWHAMARCETGGNWRDGGTWAGGLGIARTTWVAWGGREFAAVPQLATPEQQIVVANRISTQGWMKANGAFVAPVGFSGWGCAKAIGAPPLVWSEPHVILSQAFSYGDTGRKVRELQAVLGLPASGRYDGPTRNTHQLALRSLDLPAILAP